MPEFDPKNAIIGFFTGLLVLLFVPSQKAQAEMVSFEFMQSHKTVILDENDITVNDCPCDKDNDGYSIEFTLTNNGQQKLCAANEENVRIYIDGEYIATISVDRPFARTLTIRSTKPLTV